MSVRGNPTPEEVAAVLAVLSRYAPAGEPSGYERWLAVRRHALRQNSRS